jgi:lysophospholipase L1-like esterase
MVGFHVPMGKFPARYLLLSLVVFLAVVATVVVGEHRGQAGNDPARWVGSWATAATGPGAGVSGAGFTNTTMRMTVHTSIGGDQARIRLSNAFGTQALDVGHATIGLPAASGTADVAAGSLRQITFDGTNSVTIPRGGEVWSDPVDMAVPASHDVTVSIWLPVPTGPSTFHFVARENTWRGDGDHASDTSGSALPTKSTSWYFLTGLDVRTRVAHGSVVVLGDSISDGFMTTVNGDKRWPDLLGARLAKRPDADHAPGVLDAGVSGAMLSGDGIDIKLNELGVNALARLDRDVFAQTGAKTVVLELGINDIWIRQDGPDAIITRMRQVAARVHQHGMRIVVCTLSPWQGYTKWTAELDQTRHAVNAWVRTGSGFDGVIDFDALLRDPEQPDRLRPQWDSGDHIHPNDAGNQAMADAVPLNLMLG